jgi:hypothetical protein
MTNPLIKDLNESLRYSKLPRLCEAIVSAETPEDHLQATLTLLWKVADMPDTLPDLRHAMREAWETTAQSQPWAQDRVPIPSHFVGPTSPMCGPVREGWYTMIFQLILMAHVPQVLSAARRVSNALPRATSQTSGLPDHLMSLPAWRQDHYKGRCWPADRLFSAKEYVQWAILEFISSTMTEDEWNTFMQAAREESR